MSAPTVAATAAVLALQLALQGTSSQQLAGMLLLGLLALVFWLASRPTGNS